MKPLKHHKINDFSTEDIKIIFFKTTASQPVKNNAQNLKIMSFRSNNLKLNPPSSVSKIYQLPKMIKITPKISAICGISPGIIQLECFYQAN